MCSESCGVSSHPTSSEVIFSRHRILEYVLKAGRPCRTASAKERTELAEQICWSSVSAVSSSACYEGEGGGGARTSGWRRSCGVSTRHREIFQAKRGARGPSLQRPSRARARVTPSQDSPLDAASSRLAFWRILQKWIDQWSGEPSSNPSEISAMPTSPRLRRN